MKHLLLALSLGLAACSSSPDQEGPRSYILDAIAPETTCAQPADSTLPTSSSCRPLGPASSLCPLTLTTLDVWECDDADGEQRRPDIAGCTATSRPPGVTRFACRAQLCAEVTGSPDCGGKTEFACPSGAGSYVSGCTRLDSDAGASGTLTFCCGGN